MSAQNSKGIQTLLDVRPALHSSRPKLKVEDHQQLTRREEKGRTGSTKDSTERYHFLPHTTSHFPPKLTYPRQLENTVQNESKTPAPKPRRKSKTTANRKRRNSRNLKKKSASLPFPPRVHHPTHPQPFNRQRSEQSHTSGNKKAEEDASKDADEQVKAIKSAGDKQGQQVVDDLLRVVTDVRPEVPDRVAVPGKA
ncbi:MAG: hypothetical protein L6R40_000545 [Gallowayella cf. fulva]|nr:MAG: hypothetical protein L6R40_000545 [Xanthomendoza cf. fulva]